MSTAAPIVFLGPTMPVDEAAAVLAADYRPPVELGDVWRATQERPLAIGIVDGFFHSVPAVWHKEILFAMAAGIPVYGAASMGALRASELAEFGMRPVGAIANAYCDGTLTADDEVVLAHAASDDDYRAFSVPLVNVRATLAMAVTAGILAAPSADRVLATARACYYTDRRWPDLVARAGLNTVEQARFKAWLPAGAVDQKQADARELLRRIGEDLAASKAAPTDVGIGLGGFPASDLWVELVARETPWTALREELHLLSVHVTMTPERLGRGEVPMPIDDWAECWRRLRCKDALAPVTPPPDATGTDELLDWFFGERLGWPDNIDRFLRDRGWTDAAVVVAVAAREAAYLRCAALAQSALDRRSGDYESHATCRTGQLQATGLGVLPPQGNVSHPS
ncbi:hypothetical protein GCM10009744_65090 [Kribbella alba]|uniref:TfuA-like core domain-containing protein n=1 Tax=Kribbella alba TaxID=190197 RepID=A0ABN2FYR8_9ACTN